VSSCPGLILKTWTFLNKRTSPRYSRFSYQGKILGALENRKSQVYQILNSKHQIPSTSLRTGLNKFKIQMPKHFWKPFHKLNHFFSHYTSSFRAWHGIHSPDLLDSGFRRNDGIGPSKYGGLSGESLALANFKVRSSKSYCFEFWILVIWVCLGFRISCLEFLPLNLQIQSSLSINGVEWLARGNEEGKHVPNNDCSIAHHKTRGAYQCEFGPSFIHIPQDKGTHKCPQYLCD